MNTEPGIPGTIGEEARGLKWIRLTDHVAGRAYRADTRDGGSLLALVSQDPSGSNGRKLWHISVSHRNGNNHPDRVPTWDELKHAAYRLIQADVGLVLVFPKRSEPYVDIHPTTLHLYEEEDS